MQFKMSRDSLFAILLRSPWWVSVLIAVVAATLAYQLLPEAYRVASFVSGLPFLVIAVIAASRQLRSLSPEQVSATLETAGTLSWREFSDRLEQAFRNDGYTVERLPGAAADFALYKEGRNSVVSAKRWKAANHGVEALRELQKIRQARDASEAIYVAGGTVSEAARRYATDHAIRLLYGAELAKLLRTVKLH